jgi:hypothetical protein
VIKQILALAFLSVAPVGPAFGQAICPDGSYVSNGPCRICPDGSYVGGSGACAIAPDGT